MQTELAAAPAKREPTLPGVNEKMQEFVQDREIAGAVTLVATKDRVLHLAATGWSDAAARTSLRTDAIFWIASMTKPITAAAILMLQDDGKLSVDDPVTKYLPELAALKTPEGMPAVITIRQLLTHTSGMGEIDGSEAKQSKTLADAVALYAAKPMRFEPGARWEYCQSSINTAARIVEVVSGQPFPEFLKKRLFGPLGMVDTRFTLSRAQFSRLAKSYHRTDAGTLQEAPISILHGLSPTDRNRFPAANGGLFSTAPDYVRFCQMLLNRGVFGRHRLLSQKSVTLLSAVLTGDLVTGFTPGNGWGLGVCVVREPQGVSEHLSPGSFGHGGAYGTQAWIDPVKGRIYILMVQRANFPNSDDSDVRKAFQQAAGDALR